MRDMRNLHLQLQEYADCFMETDYIKELMDISKKGVGGDATGDLTEVALKYLALAILLGVEEEAQQVSITTKGEMDGTCRLIGNSAARLPKPPAGLPMEMVKIVRCITDLDADSGSRKLIYGLRTDQLEIDVQVDRLDGAEELTLTLPRIREA